MKLDRAIDTHPMGSAAPHGTARDRRLESTFFMINVIFLLLLFFVVAGSLNMNIAVTPPRADTAQVPVLADVRLAIDAHGKLRLNGADITAAELPAAVAARGHVPALSLEADAAVDAVIVAQTLDALGALDFGQITLVTLGRVAAAPAATARR